MAKPILTIAGASGVVGRHIIELAGRENWQIRIISRTPHSASASVSCFLWDPQSNDKALRENTIQALEGSSVLINLAGETLARGRLNKEHRERVRTSRLESTKALISAFRACKKPPGIWAQASAVGYYGDTGESEVTEADPPGDLFLSKVGTGWENTILEFAKKQPSLRLIIARFGLVLAKDAPAWKKLLKPISLGLGGKIGNGNQWISWIDADDIAGAFFYLFKKEKEKGIYNFTTPDPVRQKDMGKAAAKILNRPFFAKVPAFLARILLGKTADELLLASCKAMPGRLLNAQYSFKHPDLQQELLHLMTKPR